MTDALATQLVSLCAERNVRLATAESCTGGLIAAAITDVPGSSAVLDRGFVTYSNEAKGDMLNVSPELIESVGAVSSEVAGRMALGALSRSHADLSVAVTGIAGPGGGTAEKPVGLVYLAIAKRFEDEAMLLTERRLMLADTFERDGRSGVREETRRIALQTLVDAVALERP